MGRKFDRFRKLEGKDKLLFFQAVGWLAIARGMLVVFSFQRLSERLAETGRAAGTEPDPEDLRRISYAVSAAANHVPWRSDCFPQSIAARKLLDRRGYASTIHLGVERVGDADLAGHAWTTCGDTVVTGGGDLDRYTELHRFPR
jgi:hypothetical protein